MIKHSLDWYKKRIRKKIRRLTKSRHGHDNYDLEKGLTVWNEDHAEYLFNLQEDNDYRYEELEDTVKPTKSFHGSLVE